MPLQDLTPQLRTRLNRMERAVGWFIMIATLLLLIGLGYYIYRTAENRGWFKIKAPFFTYTQNGSGLLVGNKVYLLGFGVGQIVEIKMMPPTYGRVSTNNVRVVFNVEEPNFGYIWTDSSRVQVKSLSLLSGRSLDITKGLYGHVIYLTNDFRTDMTVGALKTMDHPEYWRLGQDIMDGTNVVLGAWKSLTNNLDLLSQHLGTGMFCAINTKAPRRHITAVWNNTNRVYERFYGTNIYKLPPYEEPEVTDRLNAMAAQIQAALPNFLNLTNQLGNVLSNANQLTANLNSIAVSARPAVANLETITENLKNPNGSLGQWVLPTNINSKLDTTLQNANATLATADGTVATLNTNLLTLNLTLQNLANITSNLNNQVQANTNLVTSISDTIVHSDQFIQGLKKFWLFRHLFTAQGKPKGYNQPKQK